MVTADDTDHATSLAPAISRVLVVEDVAAMRIFLRHALIRSGMQVVEADSLAAARAVLASDTGLTSVLLDLALPDGNGLDLLGEIPLSLPVAALTADDTKETILLCREAGCAGFFVKGEGRGDPAAIVRAIEGLAEAAPKQVAPDAELQRRYREYLGEVLKELEAASEIRDILQIRNIVHRLRGTAIHFGYVRVAADARAVSEAMATDPAEGMMRAIASLSEALAEAKRSPPPV